LGINRLSLGVQSVDDDTLKWMNRHHTFEDSIRAIDIISHHSINNISVDLIYGTPNLTDEKWLETLTLFSSIEIVKHISAYALTVEPKTVLAKKIKLNPDLMIKDENVERHFIILTEWAKDNQFIHYEVSNLSKLNYQAIHNSNYWNGTAYEGYGPSAHSFDGRHIRAWNVSHNQQYIKSIEEGVIPSQNEFLTKDEHYNEFVMTQLRLIHGINIQLFNSLFDTSYLEYLFDEIKNYTLQKFLNILETNISIKREHRFLSDGIASSLMKVSG
jgi:oxygen-independent coproporphyrinogen-3 oxidase